MTTFDCEELPKERVVERIEIKDNTRCWMEKIEELSRYKKILVIVGQNVDYSNKDIDNMRKFYKLFNCVFAVEHVSNVNFDGCVYTYPISKCEYSSIEYT